MEIKTIDVKGFEIPETPGLDPITVYYRDIAPGKGSMTITCYGSAWTMYWGAMSKDTVLQFFATAAGELSGE